MGPYRDFETDEGPDLPKRTTFGDVFKETPVAVLQGRHLESIRVGSVHRFENVYTYHNIGMPITCYGHLSYLMHTNTANFS